MVDVDGFDLITCINCLKINTFCNINIKHLKFSRLSLYMDISKRQKFSTNVNYLISIVCCI